MGLSFELELADCSYWLLLLLLLLKGPSFDYHLAPSLKEKRGASEVCLALVA